MKKTIMYKNWSWEIEREYTYNADAMQKFVELAGVRNEEEAMPYLVGHSVAAWFKTDEERNVFCSAKNCVIDWKATHGKTA